MSAQKKYDVEMVVPALKEYFLHHGYMPTYEELGNQLGIKSRSIVHDYLLEAERNGDIKIGRDQKGRVKQRAIYIKGMKVKWV